MLAGFGDATTPYPIDLELANGATRITLKGHIRDPLALSGADLQFDARRPDMALLLPLTGVATPSTPPYRISGRLDFRDGQVKFTDFTGRVGSSDLNGEVDVDPRGAQTVLRGGDRFCIRSISRIWAVSSARHQRREPLMTRTNRRAGRRGETRGGQS